MNKSQTTFEVPEKSGQTLLGIHLDIQTLRAVEVGHGRVKAWRNIPYPPGVEPGKPGFAAFMKDALADVHGVRHAPVWMVCSMPSLQVRFLSMPKVRPRQVSNLVYWTYRKEIPFDAATTSFDYDVEGEVAIAGQARKTDVTAYTVAREEVDRITGLCTEAGLNLEGVMIPSFAMRNVFRSLPAVAGETVIGLYVGDDSSSIMFIKGRQVVSHRVFKTGMNSILDVLRDRYPDWSVAEALNRIDKAMQADADAAEASVRLRETIQAAFGRLVQQVERSMSAYMVGRSEEEIKAIHVAGSLNAFPRLMVELGTRLGISAIPLNGFDGHAKQPKTGDGVKSEEGGMLAMALGAALSDPAASPNLLHTYIKRDHEVRAAHAHRVISVLGVAGIVMMVGFHAVLSQYNDQIRRDLDEQRAHLEKFAPYPDRAMILDMMGKAAVHSVQLRSMAERCLPVAVLNQIALGTPADIRLVSVNLERRDAPGAAVSASNRRGGGVLEGTPKPQIVRVKLEGMVFGDTSLQESKLASFIMRIEDADMFRRVALTKSEQGREGADPVLAFGLDMEVEEFTNPLVAAAVSPVTQGVTP